MINDLDRTHDIHVWRNFIPEEEHYVAYSPHIIYSSFKVEDVYHSIANARTYLHFYESEYFGDLISNHDELHLTFIKSRMLTSSLAFYNYAIDLSWQVLWYYWGDCTYLFMEDNELYEKYANYCNIKTLNERLSMYEDFNMKNLVNLFFENKLTKEIRNNYNYIKHRGVMHTPGLGEQYSSSFMSVSFDENESYSYSTLQRKTFEIEEWFLKLMDFDKAFHVYFTQIINHVIPENFQGHKTDVIDFINYSKERKHFLERELESYKTKFKSFY